MILGEKGGYVLRSAEAGDAERYYAQNFTPLDPECARLTGSRADFTHDEVVDFFRTCVDDPGRYDFLLIAPGGEIVGEAVLNELDRDLRRANFRTAIFRPEHRGRGLGSWMVCAVRDFAFETVGLHRLELDVFSFNPGAEQVYVNAGFRREGVLRDAVRDRDKYGDDILMAILEGEWRTLRARETP